MRMTTVALGVVALTVTTGLGGTSLKTHAYPPSQLSPLPPIGVQIARLVTDALEAQAEQLNDRVLVRRVQRFYAARGYQPAWLWDGERQAAQVFLERMLSAADDGLPHWPARARQWQDWQRDVTNLETAVQSDVAFTTELVTFATQLAYGVGEESRRATDIVRLLAAARDPHSARDAVARLEPHHLEYRHLRQAHRGYRQLELSGGWREVPDGVVLKRDDPTGAPTLEALEQETAVRAVCDRLIVTRDLPESSDCGFALDAAPSYGPVLEAAVRRFQTRHGLVVDGIVGPNTIRAMNVPVDERTAQLAVNMNRWRALPDDLGRRHVLVNAAGFWLRARATGRPDLTMRVVAGEPETPTPMMSDEISYLEFRPYWNVPRSITVNELLPQIARDPSYLRRNHFEVVDGWSESAPVVSPSTIDWRAARHEFPYRLRQRPGPWNSLGLVKFMFPNEYNVYLHDTPATHRFDARRRAFSHGCVRVEDPVALAEFLLEDDASWTRDAIVAAMNGYQRQVVSLPEPVPVHLTYFTAWTENGTVHFRSDLYGHDAADKWVIQRTTDSL